MSRQYGLWNDKVFVYDGDKILVYHGDYRVATLLLVENKVEFLKKKLEEIEATIGYNKVSRNMYFGGMGTSLMGAMFAQSLEQSNISLLISLALGTASLGLGVVGLKINNDIKYDSILKKVTEERLLKEREVLKRLKSSYKNEEFSLSRVDSKKMTDNMEEELISETEERLKSRSLIHTFKKKI